jgi:hypothetical protein
MYMTPPPDQFTDLYTTPEGRIRHDLLYRQIHHISKDRTATPSQISATFATFRQDRFINTGMEGLIGSQSTYHLEDLCLGMPQIVQTMHASDPFNPTARQRDKPRATLRSLAREHGYRYLVGVRGLLDALRESKQPPARLGRFLLGRDEFERAFLPMLDSAFMVNEAGDCPKAVFYSLRLMLEELRELCGWQEVANQGVHARGNCTALDEAEEGLACCEVEMLAPNKGRKRKIRGE